MSTPTGIIQTRLPGGNGGVTWEHVARYDEHIRREAIPLGWSMRRIRSHIVIESRGNPRATQHNVSNGPSHGLMQIVPFGVGWEGWHELIREKANLSKRATDLDVIDALYDPAINIAVGVAILEDFWRRYNRDPDKASSAFFLGNPNWSGGDTVNGTSGADYRRALYELDAEQKAFEPRDPIAVIMGRDQYSDDYGFKSPTSLPYYAYFVGHGGNANQHTGIDVPGRIGDPLSTPGDGIVTCAGTNVGPGSWRTGCGAFGAPDSGGVGRVEIMLDGDVSLVLGHCQHVSVRAGERVQAGQRVASIGSMNGAHVHIETRIWRNGDYLITDPRATLLDLLGGSLIPAPGTPSYVERLPTPQPQEFDDLWAIQAADEGVKTRQHTGEDAGEVGPPLDADEVFHAPYLTIGRDGEAFWISSLGSRVALADTYTRDERLLTELEAFLVRSGVTLGVDVTALTALRKAATQEVEAARVEVDARLQQAITAIEAA